MAEDKKRKKGKEKGKEGPWIDVQAIRWSQHLRLEVQERGREDFLPIEEIVDVAPRAVIGPPNTPPCIITPDPPPIDFCSTINVDRIRMTPDGLLVEAAGQKLSFTLQQALTKQKTRAKTVTADRRQRPSARRSSPEMEH